MSTQPNMDLFPEPNASILELPTTETQAWSVAQMSPEAAAKRTDISPEILFRAAQIGMIAAHDWQLRADWVSVMSKATGPSGDI